MQRVFLILLKRGVAEQRSTPYSAQQSVATTCQVIEASSGACLIVVAFVALQLLLQQPLSTAIAALQCQPP
jgi:hypothetical protein